MDTIKIVSFELFDFQVTVTVEKFDQVHFMV